MSALTFLSTSVSRLVGEIDVPGDKSISHRAIILSAISDGETIIHHYLNSDDCHATQYALKMMGVEIQQTSGNLHIKGVGKHGLIPPSAAIDCGNSGTTMRLLAGLLSSQKFDSDLTGDSSLLKRPMSRVALPLQQMGASIFTHEGCAPIKIKGGKRLRGITYQLEQPSAQVKSAILLAGMYAYGQTSIIEPVLTRDHTEIMLKQFSYSLYKQHKAIYINGASSCQGCEVYVPGDISSAAFFIVAAAIVPGSEVWIKDVGVNPTRTGILKILRKMGAYIELHNLRQTNGEYIADLFIKHAPLTGITIPSSWVSLAIDEFPAIFIAAACAKGETLLYGAYELRVKESDRIAAMIEGLQALGIRAEDLEDGVLIHGGKIQGGIVDSYSDHRIAMAFAIAGAIATNPVKILNCEKVTTSFPNFIEVANKMQLSIQAVT